MIFDILKSTLKEKALDTLSEKLGTDTSTAETGIDKALPLILSALGKNTESSAGAESLLEALNGDHDGSILDNLSSQLGTEEEKKDGSKILEHVFKGQKDTAVETVAKETGMDKSASGDLMSMLAPIVLGQLGKTNQQQQLDPGSLTTLLGQEKKETDNMLGEMAKKLIDADGDGSIIDDLLNKGKDLLEDLMKKN